MRVLHLTYDYPDIINPDKTKAIKNFIDCIENTGDNYFISLNRTVKGYSEVVHNLDKGVSISTFGLPKGIFFRYTLKHSIDRVRSLNIDFKSFDLVHAHKLTFEGPIAFYLCKTYGVPFIVSIQQTDFKIIKFRPDLLLYYRSILICSQKIVIISPWMRSELKRLLGEQFYHEIEGKIVNIPLIVEPQRFFKPLDNNKLVTVFNMKKENISIKNIYRVLAAIRELKDEGENIRLDIIGDGSGKVKVERMIKEFGLEENISLLGKIGNSQIPEKQSSYKAFILCSYPETFGMVYIEALSAGIPVIYTKNAGIDGFFEDGNIGIKVKYNSIEEIKGAILGIIHNHEFYKENVKKMQSSGELDQFKKESVIEKYLSAIFSI